YLKGQPKLGLWYPKDSPFDLVAYTDSDYVGASLDRKSTIGGCQYLGCRLISWQFKKETVVANSTTEFEYVAASSCRGQLYLILLGKAKKSVRLMMGKKFGIELKLIPFWSTVMAKTIKGEEQLHALVDGKKIIITESSVRRDLQLSDDDLIENVANEAVYKELGDSLVRAATTSSSLEAKQDSGNINKTQSMTAPNESSSLETTSGGGPRCQETIGDIIAQTRLKLDELMELCTTLQQRVLDLEKTKTTQHNEIVSLKRRVMKLEEKDRSRTHRLKRLYKVGLTAKVESSGDEESLGEDASKQGRIDVIDADKEITLVSVQNGDETMFDVNVLDVSVVGNVVSTASVATTVSAATTTTATITTVDDITLAQALMEIKSIKPKEKGVVIQESGESTTTISSQLSSQQSQVKGKGILIESEKPMKKKYLIRLDEETALKLQVEFDEEEILAREKAEKEREANIALIETWDYIQEKIDVDHQLAERLQTQEQEELSIEEKATLFQQFLDKRRKHFAAKRAEEKRNKPPIKAQQRKIMCTYLKNMEGYKLNDLKLKEFDSIQEMFDRAFKRVNTFKDFRIELVEGKEKRAGTELIYMFVEKKYPLAPLTLSMMLEKKLIIDYESEMAYQLLKFIIKQLKKVSTAQRLQRKYAKCLLLLIHNCSAEVNAASENMLEVTTASEYQVNAAISAIVSATSSSEYSSWSENRSKSGDLDSSRLSVLKCFLDDRNSCSGSLKVYAIGGSFVDLEVGDQFEETLICNLGFLDSVVLLFNLVLILINCTRLSESSDNWLSFVILSSLSQDVYLGHVFSDNSESVWKELQETYDRIDGSIVFNLLQKINSFKKSGLPISEYYHKLNSLWREFNILTKLPDYVCEARVELIDHGKLLKLMPFLMGLDDIYQPIRSSLLTREILHEVNDTFVTIAREESHRAIPLTFAKSDKPQAAVFVSRTNDVKRNNSTAIWNNGSFNPLNRAFMARIDNDSDEGEVLNELVEYENVRMLRREKAINSFDGDDLAFQCMIEFRKLYLMRRSLEVLRKFHLTTLGGRFNQLSHVSSPLLSKPGEY
ncbi:hypothetical protein Tco_0478582, partial [Tanacetum coccineum]